MEGRLQCRGPAGRLMCRPAGPPGRGPTKRRSARVPAGRDDRADPHARVESSRRGVGPGRGNTPGPSLAGVCRTWAKGKCRCRRRRHRRSRLKRRRCARRGCRGGGGFAAGSGGDATSRAAKRRWRSGRRGGCACRPWSAACSSLADQFEFLAPRIPKLFGRGLKAGSICVTAGSAADLNHARITVEQDLPLAPGAVVYHDLRTSLLQEHFEQVLLLRCDADRFPSRRGGTGLAPDAGRRAIARLRWQPRIDGAHHEGSTLAAHRRVHRHEDDSARALRGPEERSELIGAQDRQDRESCAVLPGDVESALASRHRLLIEPGLRERRRP
jgi:hypothetical protein